MIKERTHLPRIFFCTTLGFLMGIFSAFMTIMSFPEYVGTKIIPLIIFNRFLIGFFIGISDAVKITPIVRGPVIGGLIGLGIAVPLPTVHAITLFLFSIFYGFIIDVGVTKLFARLN